MAVLKATSRDHDYAVCDDPDCPRFPCRVYKEGYDRGYRQGYDRGWTDGYSAGYGAGYSAGMAAGGS